MFRDWPFDPLATKNPKAERYRPLVVVSGVSESLGSTILGASSGGETAGGWSGSGSPGNVMKWLYPGQQDLTKTIGERPWR
jgi:hypothetical protein